MLRTNYYYGIIWKRLSGMSGWGNHDEEAQWHVKAGSQAWAYQSNILKYGYLECVKTTPDIDVIYSWSIIRQLDTFTIHT